MATHTDGPWEVDAVNSEHLHDIIMGYKIPHAGYPILLATVFYDDNGGPGDIAPSEAAANARLIAAAPDLLEALKSLMEVQDCDTDCWCEEDENRPRPCEACAGRAAIAKAEGRT